MLGGAKPEDIQVKASGFRDGHIRVSAFKNLPVEIYSKMKELEAQEQAEDAALSLRMECSASEARNYQQHILQMITRREKNLEASSAKMQTLEEVRQKLQDQVKRETLENKEEKTKSLEKLERSIVFQEKSRESLKKEIAYLKEDEALLKKEGPVAGLTLKYLVLSKTNKLAEEFSNTVKTYESMNKTLENLKLQKVSMNELYRSQKDLDYTFKRLLNQVRSMSSLKEQMAKF